MRKRGQVAVFVIIGLVIAVAVILVYAFYPNLNTVISGEIIPNSYLRTCVEQDVRESVTLLADQGGYSDPQGYVLYGGNRVKYLCYQSEYYLPCVVQQPLIIGQFEDELEDLTTARVETCIRELRQEYQSRGYEVSDIPQIDTNVELLPERISVMVDAPFTATKDTTTTFRSFTIDIPSQMYDLLLISSSIIDYESTYGDSETTSYLRYYPDLEIDKIKLGDGSTVYRLKSVETEEDFTFASRSGAWPPGYGTTT